MESSLYLSAMALLQQDPKNAKALYRVAYCYENGYHVRKNINEAVKYYKKALKYNSEEAQFYLGHCLESGKYSKANPNLAFTYYKKAAENNHVGAQVSVANCYFENKDYKNAYSWWLKSANSNDAVGQFSLGNCYINGCGVFANPIEALRCYQAAKENGHEGASEILANPRFQNIIANCYLHGYRVEKNLLLAFSWFTEAAKNGHEDAKKQLENPELLNEVANIFIGLGDAKEAFNLLCKAAKYGHPKAQKSLGDCYFEGLGVDKNLRGACYYYNEAYKNGDMDAQISLASCYYNGFGVDKNFIAAFKLYGDVYKNGDARVKEAAKKILENPGFLNKVARCCFENGSSKAAFVLWRKSAIMGNSASQLSLAKCYEKGIGVKKDEKVAFEWYELAAEAGGSVAQFSLAKCYKNGIGVDVDGSMALFWYESSAKKGFVGSKLALANLYKDGIAVEQNYSMALFWYNEAAKQNLLNPAFQTNISGSCSSDANDSSALSQCRMAAESGNSNAQYSLAFSLHKGINCQKDIIEASRWYNRAARSGDHEGAIFAISDPGFQNEVAKKLNIEESYEEAFQWWKAAANSGHLEASFQLAECYRFGEGVKQNILLARRWYNEAAKGGYDLAKNSVSNLRFDPRVVMMKNLGKGELDLKSLVGENDKSVFDKPQRRKSFVEKVEEDKGKEKKLT